MEGRELRRQLRESSVEKTNNKRESSPCTSRGLTPAEAFRRPSFASSVRDVRTGAIKRARRVATAWSGLAAGNSACEDIFLQAVTRRDRGGLGKVL